MKPISIPDELVPQHWKRFTIGAPVGEEENISPVEAIVPMNGHRRYAMLIEIDESDRMALAHNGGLFWLQIYSGSLPPFSVNVVEDVRVEGEE